MTAEPPVAHRCSSYFSKPSELTHGRICYEHFVGKRGRRREREWAASRPLGLPQPLNTRDEPVILTTVKDSESAIKHAQLGDYAAAQKAAADAVAEDLDSLRRILGQVDRFDLLRRLTLREIAHDPEHYVESQHDGLMAIVHLVSRVAAEYSTARRDADVLLVTPDVVDQVHELARRAITNAHTRRAMRAHGEGTVDAMVSFRAALADVYWGPASWIEDRVAMIDRLLGGNIPRYAEEVLRFTIDEVRAVVEALGRFAEYMTVVTMIEPRGLQPRPGALADDSGVAEEVTAEILQWFGLELGLPPVVDPVAAVREPRERPLLYCDGDFFCPTDDVLWWAIQARLESSFKNTRRWEKYQSHRRRLVEDDALRILTQVLNPDIGMGEAKYESSTGAGELDVICKIDRVAVVVEAKAGMLRSQAWQGLSKALHDGLGDTVGTANSQLNRFVAALRTDGVVHLRSRVGGETTISSDDVDEVFSIIVTLEDLGQFVNDTEFMRQLGIDLRGENPPAMFSLPSLQQTASLLDTPWAFLHYLHRRQATVRRHDVHAPEELDLVMLYMRQNLFYDHDEPSLLMLESETDPLDQWDNYRRGARRTKAKKPTQNVPQFLRRLLDGLAAHPAGWLRVSFHILDQSEGARKFIGKQLGEARQRLRRDHRVHDVSANSQHNDGPLSGLTVVVGEADDFDVDDKAHFLAHLNGLRSNPTHWFGVGIEAIGDKFRPTVVEIAEPPFDQVLPPEKVAFPPSFTGRQRTRIEFDRPR